MSLRCALTPSPVRWRSVLKVEVPHSVPCSLNGGEGGHSDRSVFPSEVDKVLSGLEILSKVFDQQSSPMVTRLLQQQVGL